MTVAASASGRRTRTAVPGWVPATALGLLVGPLLAANGGYNATSWGWSAAALAGAALVAALFRDLSRPTLLELLFIGGLLAFAIWEAIAMFWTEAPSQTPLEVERTLVYVAGALAVKAVVRRGRVADLLGGVLGGVALVCAYALGTRLFPDDFTQHAYGSGRLYTPVGYWNGLGVVAAMGVVLGVSLAARASSTLVRSLAAASVPVTLCTLYFTFSRGALLALALGLVVLLAADRRRLNLLAVAAPIVAFAGAALEVAARKVGGVKTVDPSDGHFVAAAVVVALVAAGYASFLVTRLERKVRVKRPFRLAIGWVLVGVAVLALSGAFVHFGSPPTLARKAYDSVLTSGPGGSGDLNKRLLSLSSNGRLALWHVAVREFDAHPVTGAGPGSYERVWYLHLSIGLKVRDAHSLYLETLAETGIVGLLLLSAALVAPLLAFRRARRDPLAAAALAVYVAALAHQAVDWDWELSGVTLTMILSGGALLAAARPDQRVRARRIPGVALAAVVTVAALYGLVGNLAISAAGRDTATGNFAGAASEATRAKLLAPWSATPWQLLGDAQLGLGERAKAKTSLEKAVSKDKGDWTLWLDLARPSTGANRSHAIAVAQQLNPLDPTIAKFGRALTQKPRR